MTMILLQCFVFNFIFQSHTSDNPFLKALNLNIVTRSKLFTEADRWGFMYFNSLWCYMIHGGGSVLFLVYYSMLITLPVNFSRLYFMYIQKSIQLLWDYIVVWLYLCSCGLKRWCLYLLVCSVYSQVSPLPSHPQSQFLSTWTPSGNGKYRYICIYIFFSLKKKSPNWSDDHVTIEIIQLCFLRCLTTTWPPPRNKRKR